MIENIIVYDADDLKTELKTLYDVQRACPKIVESALNQSNNPFQ